MMKNRQSLITASLLVLLTAFIIALSFGAGYSYSQRMSPRTATDLPEEFDLVWEVWGFLSSDYVNSSALDPDAMSQGAVEGMLETLDDPHTTYYDSYALEISDLEGSFEGIGAYVSIEDGELTVISPIEGGPAEQSGVRAGDKILEADGVSTTGMTITEAVLRIRGDIGTTVTLLILHEGETEPVEIPIVRDKIELDSVYLDMLPNDIAHLQILYFSDRTTTEFTDALSDALDSGAQGIILDIRGNAGGYVYVVVAVASEFLDGGIVLYEADEEGNIIDEWPGTSGGQAIGMPIAVLVNGGSASGSEVLAGALRDRADAVLIGTRTYGKGSVSIYRELSDGSTLYLTVSRWLTPDLHLIEGVGLDPDYEVELTTEDIINDRDPQLEFAVEYLEGQM